MSALFLTQCNFLRSANSYVKDSTLRGHTNFVSSVCVMPPDDTHPQGLIVTGSNDKSILAYMPGVPDPVFKLEGHTGNGEYNNLSIGLGKMLNNFVFLTCYRSRTLNRRSCV